MSKFHRKKRGYQCGGTDMKASKNNSTKVQTLLHRPYPVGDLTQSHFSNPISTILPFNYDSLFSFRKLNIFPSLACNTLFSLSSKIKMLPSYLSNMTSSKTPFIYSYFIQSYIAQFFCPNFWGKNKDAHYAWVYHNYIPCV